MPAGSPLFGRESELHMLDQLFDNIHDRGCSLGLTGGNFPDLKYDATPPNCFFYDTLYARRPTRFLAGAIRARRKCADGAGMLVEQGELAFNLFNGVRAPHGVMRRALMDALGRTR